MKEVDSKKQNFLLQSIQVVSINHIARAAREP